MTQTQKTNLNVLVLLLVLVLLAGAAMSPVMYALVLWLGRFVVLTLAMSRAVVLMSGEVCDLLDFLVGVGGLLYVVGILADVFGLPNINGRDVDFLVRAVGGAFLVLPLALAVLPRRVRSALGVCP